MGGGDLNLKKSWHPLTMRNIEKVWKLEQQALEETKKAETLKKELEQERQIQELQRLQQTSRKESGFSSSTQLKMDWMYAGATCSSSDTGSSASLQEEFLLGKRKATDLIDRQTNKPNGHFDMTLPATGALLTMNGLKANSQKDMEAKLREDPLLVIKKKEQLAIQQLALNPLISKRIRNSEHRQVHEETPLVVTTTSRDSNATPNSHRSTQHKDQSSRSEHRQYEKYENHHHRQRHEHEDRHNSRSSRFNQEERDTRLQQMKEDAQRHEQLKAERVSKFDAETKRESSEHLSEFAKRHETKNFLSRAESEAFSTHSARSLSENLQSRKHHLLKEDD